MRKIKSFLRERFPFLVQLKRRFSRGREQKTVKQLRQDVRRLQEQVAEIHQMHLSSELAVLIDLQELKSPRGVGRCSSDDTDTFV